MPEATPEQSFLFWTMAYKVSDAIIALQKAGVLARLAEKPASAETLAASSNLDLRGLRSLLHLLARVSVLKEYGGVFELCADCNLISLVDLEDKSRQWHSVRGGVLRAITTGEARDPLDSIEDGLFLANYARAMAATSRLIALHVLRMLRPAPSVCFLDLGGADSAIASVLIENRPSSRAVVVDRPAFAELVQQRRSVSGQGERIRFVAADLRHPEEITNEAKAADFVLLINVAHLLPEAALNGLLKFLGRTMRYGASLVVYDHFAPLQGPPTTADLMLADWVNCGTMFSDSPPEFAARISSAGFKEVVGRTFPSVSGSFIIAQA